MYEYIFSASYFSIFLFMWCLFTTYFSCFVVSFWFLYLLNSNSLDNLWSVSRPLLRLLFSVCWLVGGAAGFWCWCSCPYKSTSEEQSFIAIIGLICHYEELKCVKLLAQMDSWEKTEHKLKWTHFMFENFCWKKWSAVQCWMVLLQKTTTFDFIS